MNDYISRLPSLVHIKGITTGTVEQSNSNIPPAIAKLSHGSTISGFVINRDAQGNATLRTDQGDLLIKSELFLKTGSEVLIRIEHSAQQVKANIVTVDGLTLSQLKAMQDARAERNDTILQPSLAPQSSSTNTTSSNTQPVSVSNNIAQPEVQARSTTPSASNLLPPTTITPLATSTDISQLSTSPGLQQAYKADIILNAIMLKPSTNASAILQQAVPQSTTSQASSGTTLTFRILNTDIPETTLPPQAQLKNQPPSDIKTTAQQYSNYAKQVGLTLPQQNASTIAIPQNTAPSVSTPENALPTQTASTTSSATPAGTTPTPSNPASNVTITTQTIAPTPTTAPILPTNTANIPSTTPTQSSATTPPATTTNTSLNVTASASLTPATQTTTTNTAPPQTTSSNSTTRHTISPAPTAASTSPTNIALLPQATANTAAIIEATVIGQERDGEVIVQTSLGTLRLFTATPLPISSKLTLEVLQHIPAPVPSASNTLAATNTTTATDTLLQLGREWPNLQQAIQQLTALAPAAAQNLSRNIIPNIGNRFVTATLFFVSALKGGDIRSWIGTKNSQAIEQHLGNDTMQRLSSDFSALRSLFIDRPEIQQQSQQWQTLVIPFMAGDNSEQARLYIRDEEGNANSAEHQGGTRFIVELSLSHLGDMQLDGLVRSAEGKARFDLIIRTIRPLEQEIQNDIRMIYNDAAAITGNNGQIEFLAAPDALIKPHDDASTHSGHNQGILA